MQRWIAVVVGAVLVALGGCGSSGDQSAKPGSLERPDLERTFRKLTDDGSSTAVALVQTSSGIWRLDQVVRDRIFRPLGLEDTSYGAVALRPDDRMPAWLGIAVASRGRVTGDGGIVSTTDDLARFFGALLGGELLRDRLLSRCDGHISKSVWASASFRFDLPCGPAWGHGREYPAYSTVALASRDGSKVVAVAKPVSAFESVLAMAEELYCS